VSAPNEARIAVNVEDARLMALVASGDSGRPLEELYDRYELRLYRMGRVLLRDDGLAEELVQETFLRVWRMASRFDPVRGSTSAFIFSIARNLAVDLVRRPSSRPMEQLDPNEAIEDPIDHLVSAITVRQALDTLKENQRVIVEAIYGHGERAVEIADRLGVPAATIRSRAFHGLRALADSLDDLGYRSVVAEDGV
jgi:RNA polymerase sigma-70 factor, ECF subfamily